jgi:predicted membrane protein
MIIIIVIWGLCTAFFAGTGLDLTQSALAGLLATMVGVALTT